MPSSPDSPRRRHKHKHRSRSPRDKERHRKKIVYDDESEDSEYEERKHHKHKHRSRDPPSDSEEDDDHSHHHRHKDRHKRENKHRHGRIKEEPDDRDYFRRPIKKESGYIKQEPGHIKQESGSDGEGDRREQMRQRQHFDKQRRDRRKRASRFQGNNSNDEQEYGPQPPPTDEEGQAPIDKEKPNFELSGKLTEETNTYRGVVIKYSEPPEARKPKKRWRLYPFKEGQNLPVLHIHRQSAYLMGRDRKIADIPIDHPSCSKQHCVFQYRLVPYQRDNGMTGHAVRPYIIDLGSTNGTHVNNQRIEAQRYVQLLEKDVLKFGFSSREYVLLHDASKGQVEEDEGEPN